ncbi:MAG: DUF2207 domain-containing protein [Roseibacillus sp.]|nr:DUF2207 domain-containing protein [Roseibacillus sp.]
MFRFLAALVLLVLTVPASLADERILSFHSEIVVERSGDLLVTETIEVRVEGERIKRGIFRDLPTKRRGKVEPRRFEVLSVKRNGVDEFFFRESIANGVRIKIGNPHRWLRSGSDQTYEIVYRTGPQLYLEEGRDMLSWNVNGTEWDFVADEVSATVVLPEGIQPTRVWGYTGTRGKKGEDYVAVLTWTGATIETTRRLEKRENLTVALEWPPGLLGPAAYEAAAADEDYVFNLWRDFPGVILGGLFLGLAILYYLIIWALVGRDPKKGTIVPLYGPPHNLSAAALRYIDSMGRYDDLCFSSGLIGLGAKGAIRIEKEGKQYTFRRNSDTSDAGGLKHPLSKDEAQLNRELFKLPDSLEIKSSDYKTLINARKKHQKALATQSKGHLFRQNLSAFVPGLALSLAALIFGNSSALVCLFSLPLLVLALVYGADKMSRGRFGATWVVAYILLGGSVACNVFLVIQDVAEYGPWLDAIDVLERTFHLMTSLTLLFVVVVNHGFFHLLMARTRLGRKVADRIEGFRRYLSVAEEARLRSYSPDEPEKDFDLFEQFLPYAVALGCEQKWAEQFDEVLRASGSAQRVSFYSGDSAWSSGGFGGISGAVSDMSAGFSSSIASSSTSGGGGGGGGGGGSGGGGGGGGRGGW